MVLAHCQLNRLKVLSQIDSVEVITHFLTVIPADILIAVSTLSISRMTKAFHRVIGREETRMIETDAAVIDNETGS